MQQINIYTLENGKMVVAYTITLEQTYTLDDILDNNPLWLLD